MKTLFSTLILTAVLASAPVFVHAAAGNPPQQVASQGQTPALLANFASTPAPLALAQVANLPKAKAPQTQPASPKTLSDEVGTSALAPIAECLAVAGMFLAMVLWSIHELTQRKRREEQEARVKSKASSLD